jgi:hypothetical protein
VTDRSPGTQGFGRYRPWLLGAGILLTFVSGVYLAVYAVQHEAELRSLHFSRADLGWAVTACGLYCGALVFSALGWLSAARACGASIRGTLAVSIALVSQIGKYAPGNVAQHLGRAALAASHGMPLKIVMKSTLLEVASAVIAGGVVAFATGVLSTHGSNRALIELIPSVPAWWFAAGAGLAIAIGGLASFPRLVGRRQAPSLAFPAVVTTLLAHVFSLALAGLSFFAVVEMFSAPDASPLYCMAIFSIAWLAGLLTPGAPAGLGVRETILLVGLSGALGPLSLPAALMHRLVTALADGLMAVVGVVAFRIPIVRGTPAL